MDLIKGIVIVLVVVIAAAFLVVLVGSQPWIQTANDSVTFLGTPAEDTISSAPASTTPWAIAVSVVDLGLGGGAPGGVALISSVATFLIALSIAWFVFRLAQRVLKG
jgi:hypothetical protein